LLARNSRHKESSQNNKQKHQRKKFHLSSAILSEEKELKKIVTVEVKEKKHRRKGKGEKVFQFVFAARSFL
jgi:hypothetical protein